MLAGQRQSILKLRSRSAEAYEIRTVRSGGGVKVVNPAAGCDEDSGLRHHLVGAPILGGGPSDL